MPQTTVQAPFDPFLDPPAMDGADTTAAEGIAAEARMPEPDPDWLPL